METRPPNWRFLMQLWEPKMLSHNHGTKRCSFCRQYLKRISRSSVHPRHEHG